MADDKITIMPNIPVNATRKAIEEYKRNFDVIKEYYILDAGITRARYLALIENGFTKDEALQLCGK